MTDLFSQPMFQALGWTLLHFIWQGALVALLLAGVNVVLRRRSANARYVASCVALLLMAVLPIATFLLIASETQTKTGSETFAQSTNQTEKYQPTISAQKKQTDASNQAEKKSFFNQETFRKNLAVVLPYLVSIWLLGVLVLSVRAIGGWVLVQRLKRRFNREASAEWQETLAKLAEQLRVSRPVRLCESALAEVPTVIGWLRPVILVPVGALTGLSTQQIEALLAHELAHIRRHDYLVNLIQTVIETLLFYHPAVWWVSRQIRSERENCCDDLAVKACGNVLIYARALTDLEGLRHEKTELAMAADGSSLSHRIKRLLGLPTQPQRSMAWLASLLLITTVVFVSLGGNKVTQPITQAKNYVAEKVFGESKQEVQSKTNTALNHAKAEGGSLLSRIRRFLAPPTEPSKPSQESVSSEASEETPETPPSPIAEPTPPSQDSSKKKGDNKDDEDSGDFIAELAAAGYTNIKADDLIAMKIHGVTGKFISEMRAAGFTNLDADDLIAFRIHGITPDYARQIKATFGNVKADDLLGMRIHGVTPEFAKEMSSLLGEQLDVDELAAFRIHGVTPEFIKEFSSLGFGKLDAEDFLAVRIHNVTAKFIQEMQGLGFGKLSLEELLGLRIHGITPAFVKKVRDKGFTDLTVDQIIQLKQMKIIRD